MRAEELLRMLQQGDAPIVLDVRTGFEVRTGMIPGAIHAPTWKIVLGGVQLPDDFGRPLVVTCAHGPRAAVAALLLRLLGYRHVTLLQGQMAGWQRNCYPLEKRR